MVTGDVAPLEQISAPGCTGCTAIIEDVRAVYAQGGWIAGTVSTMLGAQVRGTGRHSWRATLTLHRGRQRVKTSAGAQVEFLLGGRETAEVEVAYDDGRWRVHALSLG